MHRGYILISQKVLKLSFFKNPKTFHLFCHCLLSANTKETKTLLGKQIITTNPGEFITTVKELSKETGISVRSVRTSLEQLIKEGFLTIKATNKFSIVTIIRHDDLYDSLLDTNQ